MAAGDHVKTVGSVATKDANLTSVITVPAGGVAASNTVFVAVTITGSDTHTVSGVADDGGNTYTLDESEAPLLGGAGDPKTYLFRGAITTALAENDAITVTFNATASNRGRAAVADEYEGAATLDQSTSGNGTDSTIESGPVTTTSATETLIGVSGAAGDQTIPGDTPWTDRTQVASSGGGSATNASVNLADRNVTSTDTYQFNATMGGNAAWRGLIATYTFGAGGGGTTVSPATVAAAAAVPTPTLLAGSLVTPATVGVVIAVPTPSVSAAAGTTVTPGTVAAVVAVPQSILSIPALVTPGTVAIVVTVPTATPSGGVAVSPLTVAVFSAVPKPTILGVVLEIVGRQRGRFYRFGGRLALVPLGRGVKVGFSAAESWEQVSAVFVYAGAEGAASHESAQEAVAAAWAANSGASAATLKAAIDAALQAVGFRSADGGDLA